MSENCIISPLIPFAPISNWAHIADAGKLILDVGERYQKMSYRNKYRISAANNPIQLSIPLVKGRNQRTPMSEITIHNASNWQVQHWRALTSAYRRTPFWEYYEPGLQNLMETTFERLADFNIATVRWVIKQMKMSIIVEVNSTTENLPCFHLTAFERKKQMNEFPHYYQIFEDRIGFQADLSILDLLCAEGPAALQWLQRHRAILKSF